MKNILKNFFATLRRYTTSSVINIIGLSLAFATLYVILMQVHWELTYNHGIKDAERIYQVELLNPYDGSQWLSLQSRFTSEAIIAGSPDVEFGGLITAWRENSTVLVKHNENFYEEVSIAHERITLPFLDVVGYETIAGDIHDIKKPKCVAVAQSFAEKFNVSVGDLLYNDSKHVKEDAGEVVAIYRDFPENSFLGTNGIVYDIQDENLTDRGNWNYSCFVKLKSTESKEQFEQYYLEEHSKMILQQEGMEELSELANVKVRIIPITETYFGKAMGQIGAKGNKSTVYTLIVIAMLVVIIALINFINFFFALVPIRIRSVNTHKIFGSPTSALRWNFIFESVGLVTISLFFAWLLVIYANEYLGDFFSTSLMVGNDFIVLIITILIAYLVAFLSSIYPAFYITSFPAAFVIKGSFAASKHGKRLRTILIGLQFTISLALVISTIFINRQHSFMMNYDMGFNKEHLMSTRVRYYVNSQNDISAKLIDNPYIKEVAWADGDFIAEERMSWGRPLADNQGSAYFSCYPVSWNFLKVMGIEIIEGRDFSASDELKENGTYIFNETAKNNFELTLESVINGHLDTPVEIAGFCKDFNSKPLQYGIEPFAFYVFGVHTWGNLQNLYIRTVENADIKAVKEHIAQTIVDFDPNITKEDVRIRFFDEEMEKHYKAEEKLTTLIAMFTVLSILIALMGVFGLVFFETQYRRKEIAIRRIHGSTINEILLMFNKKFVRIVLICFVIAVPVSYFAMTRWLEGFAYRTKLVWWVFALALLIVLAITVITVTFKSYKSSTENPADGIKH